VIVQQFKSKWFKKKFIKTKIKSGH